MSKFRQGPWFIWKEEAMRREGIDRDEIDIELTDEGFGITILSGVPKEITIGCASGVEEVAEIDADMNYDGDCDVCLATARLIAAAPELLEALTECLKMLKSASQQLSKSHRVHLAGRTWGGREIELAELAMAKAKGESLGLENWLMRKGGAQ